IVGPAGVTYHVPYVPDQVVGQWLETLPPSRGGRYASVDLHERQGSVRDVFGKRLRIADIAMQRLSANTGKSMGRGSHSPMNRAADEHSMTYLPTQRFYFQQQFDGSAVLKEIASLKGVQPYVASAHGNPDEIQVWSWRKTRVHWLKPRTYGKVIKRRPS